MITNIPFPGFYGSWLSSDLDNVEEREAEYLAEEHGLEASAAAELILDHMKYGTAHDYLARQWVEYFRNHVAETFDLQLDLTFESMTSPREYNFATDRIFCHISDEDVQVLFDAIPTEVLRATIKARFTSYDGFMSFYSNDVDEWLEKPLIEWDHNELGTLLEALVSQSPEFISDVCMQMTESEVYDNASQEAMDWPAFDQAFEELKLVEAGECEEDNREFPLGVTDPKTYVARYDELNHLKG